MWLQYENWRCHQYWVVWPKWSQFSRQESVQWRKKGWCSQQCECHFYSTAKKGVWWSLCIPSKDRTQDKLLPKVKAWSSRFDTSRNDHQGINSRNGWVRNQKEWIKGCAYESWSMWKPLIFILMWSLLLVLKWMNP